MLNLRRGIEHPEEIDADVRRGVQLTGVNLLVLIFAMLVASVGLNVNSTAVIIGAMLISPLMGPITALGYGLAIQDFPLLRLALRNLTIFTAISLAASTLYFALSPLNEPGSELMARTTPTLWDVLIAFFGGSAGAIAMTRRDVPNVVPGVAIATALMPPVCTAGFALAHQRWQWVGGALYLFAINSVFIAFATLLFIKLMRLRAPTLPDDSATVRRGRWLTLIIVVAVAAPSTVMAYRLVRAEAFASSARAVLVELTADAGFIVIDSRVEGAARQVTLTIGGEAPPADLARRIESALQRHGFPGSHAIVRSAMGRPLDVGGIKNDIQSSVLQQFANDNEAMRTQIKLLQNKLNAQLSKYELVQSEQAVLRGLPQEIRAQYPQVSEVTVGLALPESATPAPSRRLVMLQIKQARTLSKADRARLVAWLHVRLSGDDLRLGYE